MEKIRNFFVNDLFSGNINYDNNGLFRFIVIVFAIAIGVIIITNYIPKLFRFIKRKFGLLTFDKNEKYRRHANEYITIRTSAARYFKIYLIPTILMTVFLIGFLISTDVIFIETLPIAKETLFSISFIGVIICYVAFLVIQYVFTFTDLPDTVIPTFNDFLPPEYHTVTTTYYTSSGYGYHVAGSESHTYDANFEKNLETGIGNFLSLLLSILTFLFYGLVNYFDAIINIVYNLIILPFRRLHLAKVQSIYDDEMNKLCKDKTAPLNDGSYIFLNSGISTIDLYVDCVYDRKYYKKAKETIESKKDNTVVIYKKEGKIYANVISKFICDYDKPNFHCYIYSTHRGLVQYEIYKNPVKEYGSKEISWVKEYNVPYYIPDGNYLYYHARTIETIQYYYFKQLLSTETPLTKTIKVTLVNELGPYVKQVKLSQIKINNPKKSFTIED